MKGAIFFTTDSAYWSILVLCWGGIILIWVGGWIYQTQKRLNVDKQLRSRPDLLVRIAVAVAVAITIYIPPALWARFEFAPTWLRVLGTVCLIVSTLFTVWARLALGSMWSRVAEIKVGHMLRTQGPYQITRHPIYTGILGMLFGSMLMEGFGRWIAYFLIGLVVVTSKIPSEEHILLATFGEQYVQYQKRVPKLLPGLQLLQGRKKA